MRQVFVSSYEKRKRNNPFGKKAHHWKGGRIRNSQGYVLIYKPDHPFSDSRGYVREHRLVMEEKIGKYLQEQEVVHHINGIKDDNSIENLKIINSNDHARLHAKDIKTKFKKGDIPWHKGKKNAYSKETLDHWSKVRKNKSNSGWFGKGHKYYPHKENCLCPVCRRKRSI